MKQEAEEIHIEAHRDKINTPHTTNLTDIKQRTSTGLQTQGE